MPLSTTLFRWTARLPLPFLQLCGAGLGWLIYWSSGTYRRRMQAHVAQAGLRWSQARGAVSAAGRMVAELPWLWARPAEHRLGDLVRWEGGELIDAALASGRGLVLLTPHLGCFEVIAQSYAERYGAQRPMTALYRPARQPWLTDLVEKSRQRPGLLTAPASLAGVRLMIRSLRKGDTVGLLPDQVPPEGMGVWVPFFGRSAYTMTLASRLSQQTGAAWVLTWCERLPHGRGYVIRVSAPSEPLPADADPAESAAVMNRAMEQLILQCPDQYLWSYNRYKAPRGADPESAKAPARAGGKD
ncbi:MAG: lysophospholipid acyltransferase family protein [Leptothrix sp. (in: b-proteobacteria)]